MNGEGRHLILYDGICGLCNRLNTFVLSRDPQGLFHFAPLQGDLGHATLRRFGRDPRVLDTFYVIANYDSSTPHLLSKAKAALFVATHLKGVVRLAGIVRILPEVVLNAVYDLIARYRYRIFGRYDVCPIPKPEHKGRFIDP
jgi:predicted DCC family thiol-disulfide oxidoreductase YuxK